MGSYSTQSSQEECPVTMVAETATTTADYTVCHRVVHLASQVHLTDDAKMFRCVAVEPLIMDTPSKGHSRKKNLSIKDTLLSF